MFAENSAPCPPVLVNVNRRTRYLTEFIINTKYLNRLLSSGAVKNSSSLPIFTVADPHGDGTKGAPPRGHDSLWPTKQKIERHTEGRHCLQNVGAATKPCICPVAMSVYAPTTAR